MKAAYIHIPFCEHICHYCDFNKFFIHRQPVDEYLNTLMKEIQITLEKHPTQTLKSIFVGGGTPTALNEKQLDFLCDGIRSYLPFDQGEFTFEANPGDLSPEKLKILSNYGVNRLSFGVQSFNDRLLELIGRSHRVKDIYTALDHAHRFKFSNMSIDLIYALPQQTVDDFKDTLKKALELDLPHYSAYSLIIEQKTVFYNLMRKGQLALPTEDAEAEMYEVLLAEMAHYGKQQYEISNFSKEGFESIHNLVYWNNDEYYGFGAGAHGYIGGVRYSNHGPLKKYMEPLQSNRRPIFAENKVTKKEMMEEEMFLGLRKTKGVEIRRFQEKYSENMIDTFKDPIEAMTSKGLLMMDDHYIRLTEKGRMLGNEVFQSFLLT